MRKFIKKYFGFSTSDWLFDCFNYDLNEKDIKELHDLINNIISTKKDTQ